VGFLFGFGNCFGHQLILFTATATFTCMKYFIANGKMLKDDTLVVGPENRGLRFGDGVFETMAWVNGQLVLADEHFARLWAGMKALYFDVPKLFTPEKLLAEITALVKKNKHVAARIRLTAYRGDGGLYDPVSHTPNYFIQSWPLPSGNQVWNTNGLVTGFYTDVRKSADAISRYKHNNFLPYALAALVAKKQKWNDAILLNSQGNICDSTIANVFCVKDNTLFTPALAEGCVAGVMREAFIHFCKQQQIACTETALTPQNLLEADEVFFTNSIYNLRWVQSVADVQYGCAFLQKIYPAFMTTIYGH
jgi:branched-chain amino acid aminotransferase